MPALASSTWAWGQAPASPATATEVDGSFRSDANTKRKATKPTTAARVVRRILQAKNTITTTAIHATSAPTLTQSVSAGGAAARWSVAKAMPCNAAPTTSP